jgi:hypothetical protein
MKIFEIVIFDWDKEIEYARIAVQCETYGDMMNIASAKCQEIMERYKLDNVCWNYEEVPFVG